MSNEVNDPAYAQNGRSGKADLEQAYNEANEALTGPFGDR